MAFLEGSIAASESASKALPLQRIMEAVATGNGEFQGQQQLKSTVEDQERGKQRMSVTLTPMPGSPVPLVTIKNAPADLLNQTQERDREKAYLTPKQNVDATLSTMRSGAQRNEERLRDFGFSPRTSDVGPADVDTWNERRRARRELGGGVISSAVMAAVTRGRTDEALQRNLKNQRAAQNSMTTQKYVNPLLDQENQEEKTFFEAMRSEKGAREEARLATGQYLQARNQLFDQKNIHNFATAEEFENAARGFMEAVGGLRPDDQAAVRQVWKDRRTAFLSDRIDKLRGEEGRRVIEAYEDTPEGRARFVADQAGVDNLREHERTRFDRLAKGLFEYKSDMQRKEDQQVAAEARRESLEARRIVAEERAAAEAARRNRVEESREDRERRTLRQQQVGALSSKLDRITNEMDKNSRRFASADASTTEKAELKRQNTRLKQQALAVRDELRTYVTVISQQEYDALIAAGETPQSIAADGLRVRK